MESLQRKLRRGVDLWSLFSLGFGLAIILPVFPIITGWVNRAEKWQHLSETVLPTYLINTMVVLVAVVILSLLLAVLPAWLVANFQFPGRGFFEWALVLPLALPTYVAAFVYFPIPSEWAIPLLVKIRLNWGADVFLLCEKVFRYFVLSLTMAAVLYPYLFLTLKTSFSAQRAGVIESARMLGRSTASCLTSVALPLARPAMVGGLTLIIFEVINDYGAVHFFGVPTVTEGVFRTWFGLEDRVAALRLASLVLGLILLILWCEKWQRGKVRFNSPRDRDNGFRLDRLSGRKALIATTLCLLPFLIGFMIPVVQLILWAIPTAADVLDADFIQHTLRTIGMALLTAFLLTAIASVLAYAARLHPRFPGTLFTRVITAGYAVPGAVIAVGAMTLAGNIDRFSSGSFFLSGSLLILLYAYFFRFLTVAYEPINSGFSRLCEKLDESSRMLGLSGWQTFLRINLPLLLPTFFAASILVFVDLLKELPLTMILRPANFETLATSAFGMAKEGKIYDCAVPSLLIIFAGIAGLGCLRKMYQTLQDHA